MGIIKLATTPELQTKVADSCEKVVASCKPESYDLSKLLNMFDENVETPGKVEKTPENIVEPQPEKHEKVVESKQIVDTPRKKSGSKYNGYTRQRAEANRKWEKEQARVNLRMAPELKAKVEEHTKARGESVMGFIIRAIREQMERDSR